MENRLPDSEADFIAENSDLFCCPKCGEDLSFTPAGFDCPHCRQAYPVVQGLSSLFLPNEWESSKEDVTERMKAFYEENPFPSYDDFDNAGSLMDKARKSLFAKLLDDQIPPGTRIIECGCGTGQLTNFLSIANRTAIGVDICRNSLSLAQNFKIDNDLKRAHFYQMNLFRPCFKRQKFDLVISNGVLHHTSDPFRAFESISSLVKPKGYIIVGLYHKYGRIATDIRRVVFTATKDKLKFLDRRNVDKAVSSAKRNSWFMDQYKNPHESKHTVGEVLQWLRKTGFTYIHGVPKTIPFSAIDESEKLFKPERVGSKVERLLATMGHVFSGHKEGGLFIVIAQKSGVK
jgi:SAM-dependent methyltransferase